MYEHILALIVWDRTLKEKNVYHVTFTCNQHVIDCYFPGYRDNRRRERLEEGDVDSFSPEFFGFECPSYDDPPPPYTPPKPPDQMYPREDPPPYEAVDSSNNNNNNTSSPCPNNNNNIGCQTSPHSAQRMESSASSRGMENSSALTGSCNPVLQRHHSLPRYSDHDPGIAQLGTNEIQNAQDRSQRNSRFHLPWQRQNRQAQRNTQTLPTSTRFMDQVHIAPHLLELWEDTSSATTASDLHDRSRLPQLGGRYTQSSRIMELSDTDDLSTESGNHVDQYVQTSRHSYDSLPAVSTFNSNRPHPMPVRGGNVVPDVSLDEVSFQGSEARSMGISHSSYDNGGNSVEVGNDQCVGATNILENDSVLEAEDNIRKMEQIYDSQNLRFLRLSKLLQPSSDSSDPTCGHSCTINYSNIQKSQSAHSSLSVCSETGEKKLSTVEESALSNDVQYPCSGRMPSRLASPDSPSCSGVSENCGSCDNSSQIGSAGFSGSLCENGARYSRGSQPDHSSSHQSLSSNERNNNSLLDSSLDSTKKSNKRGENKSKRHKRQTPQSRFHNDESNGNYNKNARSSSAPARQLSFIEELKCRNEHLFNQPSSSLSPETNSSQSAPVYSSSNSENCDTSHWHMASTSVKRNNSTVSHKSSSQSSSHSSQDGLLICPRKKKSRCTKRSRGKKTSDKKKSVQDPETENAGNKQCSLV